MWEQFVGKPFWIALGGLTAIFGLAVLAFGNIFSSVLLIAVGLACFAITRKKIEWGLATAFAELFANAHGHLLFADVSGFTLSLRMVVFLGVMVGWGTLFAQSRARFSPKDQRSLAFVPLLLAVVVGFLVGFLTNEPVKAFKDGNAYLYLGYLLPILSVSWTPERKRLLLQVLFAGSVFVTLLTLGLLYLFTHFPEWMLGSIYTFIRDTRTGELTKMSGALFRVFLQSQLTIIVMLYVLAPLLWLKTLTRRSWRLIAAAFTLGLAVVFVSLSRSFWVGILVGDIVLVMLAHRFLLRGLKPAFRAASVAIASSFFAVMILVLTVLFPFPYRVGTTGDLSDLFAKRTTDMTDVAVSSRWKLLPELWDEIAASPVVGSGFGEEVAFQTDDPRVRAFSPDGTWSTYALEWGWLELWLKMGILGPIGFLWLFVAIGKSLWPKAGDDQNWLFVGLLSAMAMLYATHAFSPYLNHPLGLGFLLFLVSFMREKKSAEAVATTPAIVAAAPPPALQPSTTPFTSE